MDFSQVTIRADQPSFMGMQITVLSGTNPDIMINFSTSSSFTENLPLFVSSLNFVINHFKSKIIVLAVRKYHLMDTSKTYRPVTWNVLIGESAFKSRVALTA